MSVGGCYTDFHIDFGGTSVWYHIMRGKKVRFFNSFSGNSLSQHCPKKVMPLVWLTFEQSIPPPPLPPPFTHFQQHYVQTVRDEYLKTGLGSIFAALQSPVFVPYRESFSQMDECGFFFPNSRAESKLSIWGIYTVKSTRARTLAWLAQATRTAAGNQ